MLPADGPGTMLIFAQAVVAASLAISFHWYLLSNRLEISKHVGCERELPVNDGGLLILDD